MMPFAEALALFRYSLRATTVRLALYALAAMAMVWAGVAAIWWLPAHREHTRLERDIAARRATIVDAVRAAGVAEAERKAQAGLPLFEKKLATHAGQAELIRDVARLAAQRGVRVVSQSFDEGRSQQQDGALYLNLGLTGRYVSLRRLLADFAGLPVWLEVVEAHIERAGGRGGQVRAQLRLLTYRAARRAPT